MATNRLVCYLIMVMFRKVCMAYFLDINISQIYNYSVFMKRFDSKKL